MDIDKIRRLIPAVENSIYMNTGAGGAMPEPVAEAISSLLEAEHRHGPYTPHVFEERQKIISGVRKKTASFIGADEKEVALTDNTTSGINIIANCIDWKPGDQVVVTDAEHPGGYRPWLNLEKIKGIEMVVVPLGENDEQFLSNIESALTEKCRLVCFSHIAWCLGRRLPATQVVEIARQRDIPCIIDGAQSVGHIAVDVKEIGADFYSFPGHKWVMGPMGSGVLYAAHEAMDWVKFTSAGYNSGKMLSPVEREFSPFDDSRRFEISTRCSLLLAGMGAAFDFLSDLGTHEVEREIIENATEMMDRISRLDGIKMHLPKDEQGMAHSGLVSFEVEGINPEEMVTELWRQGNIAGRWVPHPKAVRLSVNFFNISEELAKVEDTLAGIIRDLRK